MCPMVALLKTRTSADNVLPVDYSTISASTMLPGSHTLWASVWLGIADAALSKARDATRAAVRNKPGATVPQAAKLAELTVVHQRFEASVVRALQRYEEFLRTPDREPTVSFTITMNNLKLTASTAVIEVVLGALELMGADGPWDVRQDQRKRNGLFTLTEVECLGACANAPMVQINDDNFEDLTFDSMSAILEALATDKPVKIGPQIDRHTSCPEGGATSLKDMVTANHDYRGEWK